MRGLTLHVIGEVLVGNEQNMIGVDRVDDLGRIGRGAARVGQRLYVGRAIYVGHHLEVGIDAQQLGLALGQRLRRNAVGQRASRLQIGQQHHAVGVEDFGGFGHEVDPAKDDDLGVAHLSGLARQFQGIADKIGDFENLRALIIVGQNHRLARRLETVDFRDYRGIAIARLAIIIVLAEHAQFVIEVGAGYGLVWFPSSMPRGSCSRALELPRCGPNRDGGFRTFVSS